MRVINTPSTWPPPKPWPACCTADAWGWALRVKVGSDAPGRKALKDQKRFPRDTPIAALDREREKMRATLTAEWERQRASAPPSGTIEAGKDAYLGPEHGKGLAELSAATWKVREQQLGWWCAQPAALNASVYSVKHLAAHPELRQHPKRLGLVDRSKLDLNRLRQILARAFEPTDPEEFPEEFAETSNKYRTALLHLFTVLDRDLAAAVNPIEKIAVRATRAPQPSGLDMRIIAGILEHMPSRFGRDGTTTIVRAACLAWIHITPVQLGRLTKAWARGRDPRLDFHDLPEASREEIINGAITLTIAPRLKGQSKKRRAASTIPLTPRGVEAMRAMVARPEAWGTFSCPSINKSIKRAAGRYQAALLKRGITVDLSAFTVYHLKHSLATAAQLASPGMLDRAGNVKLASEGLRSLLTHANERMSTTYTQAAIDPLARLVSANTARYVEALLAIPIKRNDKSLRLVASE